MAHEDLLGVGAVVAPLRRKDGAESSGRREPRQDLRSRPANGVACTPRHNALDGSAHSWWNETCLVERTHRVRIADGTADVCVDRLAFMRFEGQQILAERFLAVGEFEMNVVGEMEAVVHGAQRCPLKPALRKVVQEPACRSVGCDLPHGMNADVPGIWPPPEGLRETARDEVLFQHEHAIAQPGKHRRG